MKKQLFFLLFAAGIFSASVWLNACQKEATNEAETTVLQTTDRTNANSKIFPPNAHPYGQSYDDWTQVWLEQFFTYGCDDIPWVHPENVLFYQTGPVYIVAGIAEVGGSADITIPRNKALLMPLINFWWDLCPGELPADQTAEAYLSANIAGLMALIDVNSLSLTIDGAPVSNLASYAFQSDMFDLTGTPELADCFDPCIVGGGPTPTITAGYYVMLKPLSPGQHTVHYHVEVPDWDAEQDATFNITVE